MALFGSRQSISGHICYSLKDMYKVVTRGKNCELREGCSSQTGVWRAAIGYARVKAHPTFSNGIQRFRLFKDPHHNTAAQIAHIL